MNVFTTEQIKLVRNKDVWAQENDPHLSKVFERIYSNAKDTSYGWESIAESDPSLFAQALSISLAEY